MATTPVPPFAAPPDFPALSDRALGTYNAKAFAWAEAMQDTTGPNIHAIAVTAKSNADEAVAQAALATTNGAAQVALAAAQAALATTNGAAQVVLAAEQAALADADRVQTGLDRVSTAADRVQTGLDRTQTGLDRIAADASAVQASKLNLGNKSTPPILDNQGDALLAGATYYDTTLNKWRVWTGAAWGDGISSISGVSSINGMTGDVTGIATGTGTAMGTNTGDQTLSSLGAQAALVSGENIKTVNGLSIIGSGNLSTRIAPPAPTIVTTSQTVTAPAGVLAAEITVVGGGGGAGTSSTSSASGSGGNGGGAAIKTVGIAAGTAINCVIGSGGAVDTSGGTTSATIGGTVISATGGGPGAFSGGTHVYGMGTGGDINIRGGGGGTGGSSYGAGGNSIFGSGAASGSIARPGGLYGGGGGGIGGAGGQGVVVIKWFN